MQSRYGKTSSTSFAAEIKSPSRVAKPILLRNRVYDPFKISSLLTVQPNSCLSKTAISPTFLKNAFLVAAFAYNNLRSRSSIFIAASYTALRMSSPDSETKRLSFFRTATTSSKNFCIFIFPFLSLSSASCARGRRGEKHQGCTPACLILTCGCRGRTQLRIQDGKRMHPRNGAHPCQLVVRNLKNFPRLFR